MLHKTLHNGSVVAELRGVDDMTKQSSKHLLKSELITTKSTDARLYAASA